MVFHRNFLIVGVIIWQLDISRKIYKNIKQLKEIFKNPLKVKNGYIEKTNLNKKEKTIDDIVFIDTEEENAPHDLFSDQNIVKISITETSGLDIILRIKEYINTYLLNNYGAAVNFSIIKDFIDREVDVKDEEISHSIPTPLYLGLAATMIGIICGLFAMPKLAGGQFSTGIDALINGVKLAMGGSLLGLACTTVLTSFFYKNAKKYLLEDKNKQISYLQAKLLPELIRAEDTGVSGLKASLDRFARVATNISDNVLIAANQTGENIILQQEVIDKVTNLDMLKISKTNLELFNRIESNMSSFKEFSEYVSLMSQISDNLKDFALRTTNIDKVANQIDLSLQENNRLSKFLTTHFEKIESAGLAALKAVDLSDLNFKEAVGKLEQEIKNREAVLNNTAVDADSHTRDVIEKLREEIENRICLLNKNENDFEFKLTEIYSSISKKFEEIGSKYIQEFQTAYSNAIPQFKQLDQLEYLPKIQETFTTNVVNIKNDNIDNTNNLIASINQLNISVNNLKENFSNNAILIKLDLIESQLKKGKSKILQPSTESGEVVKNPQMGFWGRLRKQLRFTQRKRKHT